jgi:site-specific DNA-adenine methylase
VKLRPAYPYFGSKAAVASLIWEALGDVPNYVEPFAGSAACLLARPEQHARKVETVNDIHAYIPNFLRAVRSDPEAVATHATWPVSEVDMHARHRWLVNGPGREHVERCREDADYYDAQTAGWWVWGASCWIGTGWCSSGVDWQQLPAISGSHANEGGRLNYGQGINRAELSRQLPHLGGSNPKRPCAGGQGINRESGKTPYLTGGGNVGEDARPKRGIGINRLPHLIGPHNGRKGKTNQISGSDGSGVGYGRGIFASGRREDLLGYFQALADRLALVRITCGDWARVCTPAVTISHGLTGVLLDPPYASERSTVYAHDSRTIANDVGAWAREQGADARMRIVLCGYSGEHNLPGWHVVEWKSRGGYGRGKNANATRERLWLSPHCLGGEQSAGPLFEVRA